jgi:hypothetical protein
MYQNAIAGHGAPGKPRHLPVRLSDGYLATDGDHSKQRDDAVDRQ